MILSKLFNRGCLNLTSERVLVSIFRPRSLATLQSQSDHVTIVEVGPRDGLQNEKKIITAEDKINLINLLSESGLRRIEVTSFVSPKWVPQMADNKTVLKNINKSPNVRYSALTPNLKGFQDALDAGVQEVAIFGAASETFTKKNINCSIKESLEKFNEVVIEATKHKIPIRGYVSCVVGCPYEGHIKPLQVCQVVESLFRMGCYEVSLGDTIGVGNPLTINKLLKELKNLNNDLTAYAIHCHDTYNMALLNIYQALENGIRVIDSSCGGLGGCPYAAGASGNVATEDVLYMLKSVGIETNVDMSKIISANTKVKNKKMSVTLVDDLKSMEHSTLKVLTFIETYFQLHALQSQLKPLVPYETLNKQYRNVQKSIDRECSLISQQVNQMEKLVKSDGSSRVEVVNSLTNIVDKLRLLKRKSADLKVDEENCLNLIKKRVEYFKEYSSNRNVKLFRKQRLDRMLIDYFLRNGYYETAQLLANKSKIQDMTNIDIYLLEKEIVESLHNKDTAKCLAWCNENKSKLKKVNSNLEFMLRQQEYIELVRGQKCLEAVYHARKYFVNLTTQQMAEVQKSMVLLAYVKNSDGYIHQELLQESRWDQLIDLFKTENYKIHQLPEQSCFTVTLQAGLSSLKTPTCFRKVQAIRNPNCPVCHPSFNLIAKPLPYAYCSNSKLICSITGSQLNEDNLPMMLPNGYVYGHNTIMLLMEENNGKIKCPRTNDVFEYHELQKVFVL